MADILGVIQESRHDAFREWVRIDLLSAQYHDPLVEHEIARLMLANLDELDRLVLNEALRVVADEGLRF